MGSERINLHHYLRRQVLFARRRESAGGRDECDWWLRQIDKLATDADDRFGKDRHQQTERVVQA
jgi:hypothetical protein